jgi:hypothetical protein
LSETCPEKWRQQVEIAFAINCACAFSVTLTEMQPNQVSSF